MADLVDDGEIVNSVKLSLKDFLECFPPPQTGKIADGYSPEFEAPEAFDLPTGSILNFHRQVSPNVPLTFLDPWGGDSQVKVTLPLEFQSKFKIRPYDPESGDESMDHVYHTIQDLVTSFPVYVQANASYQTDKTKYPDLPECFIGCGDRLKLIRLVHKHDHKLLEGRLLREARLLLLPMDCVGDFTVLPDNNDYLLADLVSMLPRKRRLQVADSTQQHKIPGLPADFQGDLFMEEPEAFVEASPMDDPSLIIGLPSNLNVTISPEEGSFDRGQLLNTFANNNRNLFPVVARVTDWDEETTILENHYVKPGIELVVHGWTRQSKILAESNDQHYAIPLSYQGHFRIKPQTFEAVSELEHAHPAYKIKVIEVDEEVENCPISVGDVIRIKREDSLHKSNPKLNGEIQFLKCEKYENGSPTNGRGKDVKIPMNLHAKFEEVMELTKNEEYLVRELVSFVTEQDLVVELMAASGDQKIKERDLPLNTPITLSDYVVEPAVYVSVETAEAPAFHIPLRTLLYVTFVQQLDKSSSPLLTKQSPRLSTLDRCVEILPSVVFNALQTRSKGGSDDSGPVSSPSMVPSFNRNTSWSPVGSAMSSVHGVSTPPWQETTSTVTGFEFGDPIHAMIPHQTVRQPSFAGSDVSKSRGFAAKLKDKFRRHKSTENIPKMSHLEFSTHSLPRNSLPHEYSTHVPRVNGGVSQHMVTQQRMTNLHSNRPVETSVNGKPVNGKTQVTPSTPTARARANPQQSQQVRLHRSVDGTVTTVMVDTTHLDETQGRSGVRHEESPPLLVPPSNLQTQPARSSVSLHSHTSHLSRPVTPARSEPIPQSHPALQPQAHHNTAMTMDMNQMGVPIMQPGNASAGYMLMPMGQPSNQGGSPVMMMPPFQNNNMPAQGYMLVPIMSPQMAVPTPSSPGTPSIEDEEEEFTDMNFSRTGQFKVVIPPDGNLYHFSVKKMAEFFRQLRIEDESIRACIKDKVDGKKFSKMTELDLERFGLMHPIVVHFRRHTHKRKSSFSGFML